MGHLLKTGEDMQCNASIFPFPEKGFESFVPSKYVLLQVSVIFEFMFW